MSLPSRTRGVKVLKAISSPLRLQVLNLLYDKVGLSYTELMNSLKMNPNRDAGRFAYHLKFLLKAALIEADVETKKYVLTELGKMVIDVADRVEKKALKPRGMLVRTSHSTLEEFEASKIANSLIKEAKMPSEVAQRTAKDAEKFLVKSKTKFLTAPLVREVVNAILIEKGLEDYRHKLTRLGMPVHEVTALLETRTQGHGSASLLSRAGKAVFSEYALLNVFPRDISDAHLSGAIHIDELGTWLLKPDEVMHDLRFFLCNGLPSLNPFRHAGEPPRSFESALSVIFSSIVHCVSETNKMQNCPFFNVFLAPFAREQEVQKLKDHLHSFIININQHAEVTLGLCLTIPEWAADIPAVGAGGKTVGKYGDFNNENSLLAKLTLDVLAEETLLRPLLNPRLIVETNSETLGDEPSKAALLKAHVLAGSGNPVHFHSITQKSPQFSVLSGMGLRYQNELTGDWETDMLRTGCVGVVNINLPRIFQESERETGKFIEILKERCELAARALEIKQRAFRQHGKNTLSFLSQSANGDAYFRFENCLGIINFVGLKESIAAFSQSNIGNVTQLKLVEEVAQMTSSFKGKTGRKPGKRVFTAIIPAQVASERMAQLDVEKYGLAKVIFCGNRDRPYYSTSSRFRAARGDQVLLSEELTEIHQKLGGFTAGGNMGIIELEDSEFKPEELMNLTSQLMEKELAESWTYNRRVSYCSNCRASYFSVLHKCPSCGAISSLVIFDRFGYT